MPALLQCSAVAAAKLFPRRIIGGNVDTMSAQPLEVRMASLEGSYHQVSERLNGIDRRLDGFEQRVDARFQSLESKLDSRLDGLQWRMAALILGSWITLMASILLHR